MGVKSFDDVARMTIPEYEMRIKAYQYEELDKQRDLHYLAFLNQAVQSTTGKGKSQKMKYTSFDKFFDYEKQAKMIEGETEQAEEMDEHKKELLRLIKKANSANGKEE